MTMTITFYSWFSVLNLGDKTENVTPGTVQHFGTKDIKNNLSLKSLLVVTTCVKKKQQWLEITQKGIGPVDQTGPLSVNISEDFIDC